jgi:hypothetical protein
MKNIKQSVLMVLIASGTILSGPHASAKDIFQQIGDHIAREVTRPFRTIDTISKNPARALTLPIDDFSQACGTPVEDYGATLASQADGRWKALPDHLVAAIQSGYSNQLSQVRYAEGIRTSNGDAQTFGDSIYFPRSINLMDADDMHWLLHELQHTDQFRGNTQAAKLCDYVLQAVSVGFDHDKIRWEREADSKADRMLNPAMEAIENPPPQRSWVDRPQLAANQIAIQNDTDMPVVFRVESANTDWTAHTVAPHSSGVVTGAPGDSWFNIAVMTRGIDISYGADGASTQAIRWNEDGLLDFFRL